MNDVLSVDTLHARAQALRDMHHTHRPLVLPNAWDALSARIFEEAGFPAIATTSAGVAWALGHADGEAVPRDAMLAAIERIVRAVRVPVTADVEAGYGDTAAAVGETIAQVIRAGAVGVNLEDSTPVDGGHRMDDVATAAARIAAARDVATHCGVPLVINARVDLYLAGEGTPQARFEQTVRRAHAYLEAGADCIYPIGVLDEPTIAALVEAIGAPVNIIGKPGGPGRDALGRLGVARISSAVTPVLAIMGALRHMADDLRATGTFETMASPLAYPDAQRLFADR